LELVIWNLLFGTCYLELGSCYLQFYSFTLQKKSLAGIYIHIPFCKTKCSYCDFYSIANSSTQKDFLQALHTEINLRKKEIGSHEIKSIYFGGGTPSLLDIANLNQIFDQLYSTFSISDNCEITLEANPDDLSPDYLKNLLLTPVNRLSIGIQSNNDSILKMMRRRHNATQGTESVLRAVEAGFKNISIDLIYGIDGMSEIEWQKELASLLILPVDHLSAYHLGIEEGTLLYRKLKEGKIRKIDENVSFRQYETLIEKAKENGFLQYEISNFAKDIKISRHNSAYWNRTEYLGLGPSAHSLIGGNRIINKSDIKSYIHDCFSGKLNYEIDNLTQTDIINETIMLGLRTVTGIDLANFRLKFGEVEYKSLMSKAEKLNPEHSVLNDQHLRLTNSGMFISDSIISNLFK